MDEDLGAQPLAKVPVHVCFPLPQSHSIGALQVFGSLPSLFPSPALAKTQGCVLDHEAGRQVWSSLGTATHGAYVGAHLSLPEWLCHLCSVPDTS